MQLTNQLTSSHRLFLLIVVVFIVVMIVAYLFLPTPVVLAGCLVIFVVLWLLRPLILTPRNGATKVRILSILGIFSLAGSHSVWSDVINTAAKAMGSDPVIVQRFPWIANVEWNSEPSIAVLIFAVIGLWIVNYFMVDKSIGGYHPVPLKKDFPDENFSTKLDSFCSALRQHLETTDRQANWSPDYYTELEAEVEIVPIGGASSKKRIVELQVALRSDRQTQSFLVLGDPGGGKSVALRKLARDMLGEVSRTGRIPLYINLREWLPIGGRRATAWTEQSPPTIQELETFVLETVKARGDVFTEEFVDTYFRDMWQHGRLFFIFDSFDEIPELLDVNEESWLIDCLSDLLSRFISTNVNARGVLASRMFRRPTQTFLAQKVLDIRPMSEERIQKALARYPAFTHELRNKLFRDRHDLVPIARNPFLMALLGEWVNIHRVLPANQGDLYKSYLHMRLSKVQTKIDKYGLTVEEVLTSATQIAEFVFNSSAYGLEAPVSVLQGEHSIANVNETIEILSYARIARVSAGDITSFAFVHRRFLEYLITTRLLQHPENLPLSHIPTDSRGRDAMVLFAQLCDDASAERLALLCWREICEHFDTQATRLRAIHCLRFLIDAFRSRRAAVSSFSGELESFIRLHVSERDGLIQAKICLEATGLLTDIAAIPILQLAMAGKNAWLRDTAFRACRHIPNISSGLQRLIDDYVLYMPAREFWNKRRALIFSLSLSDSLRKTYRLAVWRKRNLQVSICALVVGALLVPQLFLAVGIVLLLFVILIGLNNSLIGFNNSLTGRNNGLTGKFSLRILAAANEAARLLFARNNLFWAFQHVFGLCLLSSQLPKTSNSRSSISFVEHYNGLGAFSDLMLSENPIYLWVPLPWVSNHFWSLGSTILIVAALLSFDWILIGSIVRIFGFFNELSLEKRRKILRLIFFSILVIPLTFSIVWWLEHFVPVWIISRIIDIFALLFIIAVIFGSLQYAYFFLSDWHTLRKTVISSRMSRHEIAQILSVARSPRLRLGIVRQIAEFKTIAFGEWPDDFKLSLSGDLAITELAKLEERWLRLDR